MQRSDLYQFLGYKKVVRKTQIKTPCLLLLGNMKKIKFSWQNFCK